MEHGIIFLDRVETRKFTAVIALLLEEKGKRLDKG
jgi:hypothetical protein